MRFGAALLVERACEQLIDTLVLRAGSVCSATVGSGWRAAAVIPGVNQSVLVR